MLKRHYLRHEMGMSYALYTSLLPVFKQMSVLELFDKIFLEICAKVKMNVVHLCKLVVLFRLRQKNAMLWTLLLLWSRVYLQCGTECVSNFGQGLCNKEIVINNYIIWKIRFRN